MTPVSGPLIPRYGVKKQTAVLDVVDRAAEELRLIGYTVIDPGFDAARVKAIADAFDAAADRYFAVHGGREVLARIDEHTTIRCMVALDDLFLELAKTPAILGLCDRLLGDAYILNQQNGIINPAMSERYSQGFYHRDLPYQHFVVSCPLAINALYCVDSFTLDNGATRIVPGSHKQEMFPADETIRALEVTAIAKAGSFIVLDCMVFHTGGRNMTQRDRRAVNHVYTLPFLKQQISLDSMLDASRYNEADRRLLDIGNQPAPNTSAYLSERRRKAGVD
jgi:ectoine hydroxylase-related dioxygenase (phytanoyl-CoA dioxygenase family)